MEINVNLTLELDISLIVKEVVLEEVHGKLLFVIHLDSQALIDIFERVESRQDDRYQKGSSFL